jgi:succinate dehydrogenase hydrophobic anchor subunit
MIAHDIGEGLTILAVAIAIAALAVRVWSRKTVAIGAGWIGVIAAAIGAAMALCGLVFAVFALWHGSNGPWGSWDGVGHKQPRHSAMVAIGVALGAAVVAIVAAVNGLWRRKRD